MSVLPGTLSLAKLEPPGVYVVTTRTSLYRIETGALRAMRAPRPRLTKPREQQPEASSAPVVVHRPLFTDGAPLLSAEVPEPVVGERMRMRIWVADEFLDHASKGTSTDMLTTEVLAVDRVRVVG